MTKVMITGAAGFLGFHLARSLSSRPGFQVICVDNFIRGESDKYFSELISKPNVTFINCDLNEASSQSMLPIDVDYIYHLAALNGTQNFYERPLEVIRCSTLPTMHLLENYGQHGTLKRFLFAGTSESYASTVTRFGWPVPTDEGVPLCIDDVMNPRWSYAASKIHGEVLTAQAGRVYNIPFTIVRFHNAFGPRMGDKHVIPDFLTRAKLGRFELFGHEDTRSFIYVDDAVSATVNVAENARCVNQIMNVGGANEISILSLAREMMRVRNFEGDIILHPSPVGSVKRRAPDLGKLQEYTGFTEKVDLAQALAITADYYIDGRLT
ncbi:NAD-dependent epimerase/dehydratase family protein [Lichenihabitans psoromatis]|uniref:NAD-dependent epimerase/dehydratase family protein n=1 Tax=Lichenihabitans psoromatis TaxID=2528642 RepID=UPI00103852EA|nr:NAD-dependent epimerase/dehydratase family protein [Lichenihabitans psoromatis]